MVEASPALLLVNFPEAAVLNQGGKQNDYSTELFLWSFINVLTRHAAKGRREQTPGSPGMCFKN